MAGSSTRDLVTGLKKPRRGKIKVGKKKPLRGTITPSAGRGGWSASPTATGGMVGPLTETNISSRRYYAQNTVYSSDGIFTFIVTPIKSMTFIDGTGYTFQIMFKPDPTPT